jgi:hypothetical protein
MTTTPSGGGSSSNTTTIQPTQILQIQQTATGTNVVQQSPQSQTIRKVGSTSNLTTLQQKVQVLNRPGIQFVQANPAQRLTKTTSNLTSSGQTTSNTNTTANTTPIQFQQVFQQATKISTTSNSVQQQQQQPKTTSK